MVHLVLKLIFRVCLYLLMHIVGCAIAGRGGKKDIKELKNILKGGMQDIYKTK